MAFFGNEFRLWAGTDTLVWCQHRNPECMNVETFDWPTFQQVLDWVDTHECGSRV